jgi:hypothetical protein
MSKLFVTFGKDLKLSINGLYFYIEIIMAIVFIAVMLIAVPNEFESNYNYYAVIDSSLAEINVLQEQPENMIIVNSREELEEAMSNDRNSIGVSMTTLNNTLNMEIILQGHESEKLRNFIKAEIEGYFITQEIAVTEHIEIEKLQEHPEKLSDRENILPVYLTINVALMGLFIIAAYIFLDKEEGLVKAYAVAPVKIWSYLASKAMVILVLGLFTSIIVVFSIVQFRVNYFLLMLMIISFNIFGSALGVLITSFYNSMIKAMEALYAVILIMMLGSITYFIPSFNPLWIRVLPVYPMLFSFRELLLNHGDKGYILQNILLFLAIGSVLFYFATKRFEKNLTI